MKNLIRGRLKLGRCADKLTPPFPENRHFSTERLRWPAAAAPAGCSSRLRFSSHPPFLASDTIVYIFFCIFLQWSSDISNLYMYVQRKILPLDFLFRAQTYQADEAEEHMQEYPFEDEAGAVHQDFKARWDYKFYQLLEDPLSSVLASA